MAQYGILPRILHEWVSVECADPAAAEIYLMVDFQVYDIYELSDENKQLFYKGWELFLDWDHKTVMNNVHAQSGYEMLSLVDRAHAEIDELEAWCELMGL